MRQQILRKLPSIDELISTPEISTLLLEHGRNFVVNEARKVVDNLRTSILDGRIVDECDLTIEKISDLVCAKIEKIFSPSIRGAVNATGIILHTGLGRAMLSEKAVDAVTDVIKGYCTLAADIETGLRVSRDIHYENLITELTGAEAATVVNNNASATMLVLNTFAKGKEVIVSRGQLVEIGGAFRMPDVMEMSGAVLREVGTTNKTHLRDYENAINENTGAILRVHMSNYRIVGFFEESSINDMAKLAEKYNLPIIDDLGSGALVDLAEYGVESEPMVKNSIDAGVDAACFSGDKLIGGPQCGIIVGKKEWISRIKKNPLARALRIGKMSAAALEATLKLFLNKTKLNEFHPTYRMLSITVDSLKKRAEYIVNELSSVAANSADIGIVEGYSQVGSGSVPAQMIPSILISIKQKNMSSESLSRKLRQNCIPIYARIHKDAVLLDLRTIQPDEDEVVLNAIKKCIMPH